MVAFNCHVNCPSISFGRKPTSIFTWISRFRDFISGFNNLLFLQNILGHSKAWYTHYLSYYLYILVICGVLMMDQNWKLVNVKKTRDFWPFWPTFLTLKISLLSRKTAKRVSHKRKRKKSLPGTLPTTAMLIFFLLKKSIKKPHIGRGKIRGGTYHL